MRFLPALLGFVGYDPLPKPQTPGQAIKAMRHTLGLSQADLARIARVDEGSVRRLELDTKGMARCVRQAVRMALGLDEDYDDCLGA